MGIGRRPTRPHDGPDARPRVHAQLIVAFVDDCAAGRFGAFDPSSPIYVVELGAGSGRLAFEIELALARERPTPCPVVYVLTDLVMGNVDFWKAHPKLMPYIAEGRVDVARFAVGSDDGLELEFAGLHVGPGDSVNPIVVVSNYLFDVLPQDSFEVVDGELFEEEVALYAREAGVDAATPDFFRQIFVAPRRIAVPADRYEPAIDALLREVVTEEVAERRFLFPAEGVRGLRGLAALSDGRLLHLIGERPGGLPEQVPDRQSVEAAIAADPDVPSGPGAISGGGAEAFRPGALLAMGVHGGSMSLPVEVPILARSLSRFGAELLLPPSLPAGLLVSAIVAGAVSDPIELRTRFAHVVGDLGPEDVYLTVKSAIEHGDDLVPSMLFAALRTGGYDPYLFRQAFGALEKKMKIIDAGGAEEAERVLRVIFEHDYPLDNSTELAYPIGILLAQAERFEGALEFFLRSVEGSARARRHRSTSRSATSTSRTQLLRSQHSPRRSTSIRSTRPCTPSSSRCTANGAERPRSNAALPFATSGRHRARSAAPGVSTLRGRLVGILVVRRIIVRSRTGEGDHLGGRPFLNPRSRRRRRRKLVDGGLCSEQLGILLDLFEGFLLRGVVRLARTVATEEAHRGTITDRTAIRYALVAKTGKDAVVSSPQSKRRAERSRAVRGSCVGVVGSERTVRHAPLDRCSAGSIDPSGRAPGALVVDIGCGGGLLAPHLEGTGYTHIGVDLSPTALALARDHGVRPVRADAGVLPFADGVADVVVAGEILEHVTDLCRRGGRGVPHPLCRRHLCDRHHRRHPARQGAGRHDRRTHPERCPAGDSRSGSLRGPRTPHRRMC